MKWSHTDLGRTLLDMQTYVQGHKGKVVAICALATVGVAYSAGVHVFGLNSVAQVDEHAHVEMVQNSTNQPRTQTLRASSNIDIDQSATRFQAPAVTGNVQVNDIAIPIPEAGEVHRQIESKDGTATVDMSVNSSNYAQNNSSQQTTLNINVESYSETSYGHEGP